MKKIVSLLALALLTMSAWAANTYVKVTSLEQLVAGQKYILVNEDNSRAMGAIAGTSTTYGSYVGITITDGIIDIEGTDVVELTADEGGTYSNGPTWHFTYDDGAYMFWNSGNSLSSISSDVANLLSGVKWVPALTTDGVILKNNGDISRILQYNSTSPRFACYTSSQKPAVLYVQDAGYTPPVTVAAPTLPESQEFENSLSVIITNNEEGADLMYALNDGEFTEYTEALTITETTTVRAKAVKGEVESEVVSATYTKVEPVVYIKPYVKVTSIDQLEAGKKYILVNEEASRAMGEISSTSTPYGTAVDVTIKNGIIDIDGTDVVELFSGEGSDDALGHHTWTFNIGEGSHYMCWTSGNSLNTVNSSAPNNAMWIATLTDDGVVLTNKADDTRKLQYNSGSPRFACYTSSQKPAVLYVEYVSQEDEGITTLSQANALEDDEEFTFNGDAVVTAFKNGYLFLRDESGYGMISGVEGTFANSQVLNQGWNATKTSNDGWVWYTDAAGLSTSDETNAELAAAQKLTAFPDESMINAYVYVEKVNKGFLPIRVLPLRDDNTSITIASYPWAVNQPATSGDWNAYGVIVKNGGTLEFALVAWEKYVEPQPEGLRGDVNMDGAVDIKDVTPLIDYLLSQDPTGISPENADCNLDDNVTIIDLTALIDRLLSGNWPD